MAEELPAKVKPGDELEYPASMFNAQIDATRFFKQQQFRGKPLSQQRADFDGVTCLARSNTDCRRFEAMQMFGVIYGPDDNAQEYADNWAVDIRNPDLGQATAQEYPQARPVVTLEPIAAGKIGRVLLSGVTPCHCYRVFNQRYADLSVIDPHSNASHPDFQVDAHLVSSSRGPFEILYHPSGSKGEGLALVRLGMTPDETTYSVYHSATNLDATDQDCYHNFDNSPLSHWAKPFIAGAGYGGGDGVIELYEPGWYHINSQLKFDLSNIAATSGENLRGQHNIQLNAGGDSDNYERSPLTSERILNPVGTPQFSTASMSVDSIIHFREFGDSDRILVRLNASFSGISSAGIDSVEGITKITRVESRNQIVVPIV